MNFLRRRWGLTAPPAAHRTPDPLTDLQQYEQYLRDLATFTAGDDRAGCLEEIAWWADMLSLDAEIAAEPDDRERIKWTETALLCRAVAATERGFILSDPSGIEDWLDGNHDAWSALALADRDDRAGILHGLHEAIAPVMIPDAAAVLEAIAATERAITPAPQDPDVTL